eukprot:scaffold69380_cov61-Phaeocystis_antarctica.AAC.2
MRRLEQDHRRDGVVKRGSVGALQREGAARVARLVLLGGRVPIDGADERGVADAIGPIERELPVHVERPGEANRPRRFRHVRVAPRHSAAVVVADAAGVLGPEVVRELVHENSGSIIDRVSVITGHVHQRFRCTKLRLTSEGGAPAVRLPVDLEVVGADVDALRQGDIRGVQMVRTDIVRRAVGRRVGTGRLNRVRVMVFVRVRIGIRVRVRVRILTLYGPNVVHSNSS